MNWFLLAITSAVLMSINNLLLRRTLRDGGDPYAFTILFELFAGLAVIPFFVFFGFSWNFNLITAIGLILATFFYAVGDFSSIKSYQYEDASVLAPIQRFRNVVVLLGSFVFLKEALTIPKLFAVIIILIGAYIISSNEGKLKISKGIFWSLLASIFLGIAFLFDKAFVSNYSLPAYMSLILFLPAIWNILFIKFNFKRIKEEYMLQKKAVILPGIFFGWALFALLASLSIGEVSRAVPVSELSIVFVVAGGILFLKERKNVLQKLLGSGLVFAGILMLTI